MGGSVIEKVIIKSDILGKEMSMRVYLPDGYGSSPMPVLFFLHGRSGSSDIIYDGGINTAADRLMLGGEIRKMIIVCPDIDNSRGINSSPVTSEIKDPDDGKTIINLGMYEDYFMQEVMPTVDRMYRIDNDRNSRFIGGVSGGGYAALHYAFRNPDMFSKVGGHMPAMEVVLKDDDRPFYPDITVWDKYDPVTIAKMSDRMSDMDVYLDAGVMDEGQFYEGCGVLHEILKRKGVRTVNHVFPGRHDLAYIRSNMERYLRFYGA